MDNPQFLAIIHHLGDDVGYISRKMEQDVAKCVEVLETKGDVKKFCRKLAAVLLNFRMYATMYAHTLEERILTFQLEGELSDVLVSLNDLTQKKDKLCIQCERKNEKVDVTIQTESEPIICEKTQTNHSDSSQETENYELSQLIVSQEVNPENSASDQETICNDTDITTDGKPGTETEKETDQSQIFRLETDNDSVDLEIKKTINHLLNEVCTALSKEGDVEDLMEELNNEISRPTSNTSQVDFLKSQDAAQLSEGDRLALLKVIKQFYVRKLRTRRSKRIPEEIESSSDEMPPAPKPRRKKKKKPITAESENGAIEESHDSPVLSSDSSNDQSENVSSGPQIGNPAPRKSVPLPETPSEDTESQAVLPFKRKIVKPLPSSHSEFEEDASVKKKEKGVKRTRPNSESDLECLREPNKRPRLSSESKWNEFNLNLADREEILRLFDQAPKTTPLVNTLEAYDSDVEFVSIEPVEVQFNLDSKEREELSNLLTKKESTNVKDHLINNNNELEEDSDSLTSFQLNDEDRGELVDLLIQSALERKNDLTNNRETLIELIKEFERSLANDYAESPLLDVVREEIVEEELPATKAGWEAFNALLDSEDDFLSNSSSTELSDSDLSINLTSTNRKVQPVLSQDVKTKFGLDKELFVDIEHVDFSHFEFTLPNSGDNRKPRRSSSSSSSLSNMDLDSLGSDIPDTPPPLSAEEPTGLAASLLDNITNSSDDELSDALSSSSSRNSESDKSSTTKNKKKLVLDSSDEEDFVGVRKSVPDWKRNPLLNIDISDSDSEVSEAEKRVRKKKPINLDPEFEESKKKPSPLKTFQVDDDSDDSDFEIISVHPKEKTPQKVITLSDEEVVKPSKGRRNIRALMEEEDLSEATQTAHNEERERIKRLQEKDKAMEVFSQSLSFASQFSEDDCHPLILDVQDTTQIKVHPKIAIKLKPHQRDGIQFMWDSCYESVKQLQAGYKGSGCILAHCMGLGKTLQALALIQTLFANPITETKHVLVVCPLSTVSNWKNEYKLAFKDVKGCDVKFYSIEDKKAANRRFNIVKKWRRTGGMLVMGYECFGLMVNEDKLEKWANAGVFDKESILQALVDPGPDLVICDEGHLLRNKQSQRTLALNKVSTRRRIILTGTPLQNNLLEYYYMVNFVKPNLLGTEKEYKINFVNPIINGQFEDSTAEDIMFMKKRTHVLHKILNRTVQRVEDTELKQYLPKLVDQAVFVKLSDLQVELYNTYLDSTNSRPVIYTKSGTINRKNFLADVQILRYICVHPNVITTAEKNAKAKIKEQDVIGDVDDDLDGKIITKGDWYKNILTADRAQHLSAGSKLLLALGIVEEAAANGDKTLIFSQSHAEMDNLEKYLVETLGYKNKLNYYRMDGTISPEVRTHMCDRFNNPNNQDIKVFIMSTKVGGLGLNLTAANRVVIMSVSWNPSYDTQSVFRTFRFGQNKPVYVYRLIAMDTMEEKMYQRSVTKLAIAHRVVDKHQITRHYNSADIQEYYSVRPTKDRTRPVPNLPEDCVLAKLIQKHQVLFKWHEHQALLTNRPEEDLDEHQKNAAWEEFNKKTDPALVNLGSAILNSQNQSNRLFNPATLTKAQIVAAQPDHTYSLPKSSLNPLTFLRRPRYILIRKSVCVSLDQRTTSAEDFIPTVIKQHPVVSLKPRPSTNQNAGPALSIEKPVRLNVLKQELKTQQKNQKQNTPTLNRGKLVLQKVTMKQSHAIGPKGVVIKATPTVRKVTQPSPMQQQVRSYMEQLHLLQQQSYLKCTASPVETKQKAVNQSSQHKLVNAPNLVQGKPLNILSYAPKKTPDHAPVKLPRPSPLKLLKISLNKDRRNNLKISHAHPNNNCNTSTLERKSSNLSISKTNDSKPIRIISKKFDQGRGNDTIIMDHAPNIQPPTNKINVQQNVSDWIADTLKYMKSNYNSSPSKQNDSSVKPTNSTSNLSTNQKRIQWKQKSPSDKKKTGPKTNKENSTFLPSEVVHSLQKKGVSVSRVNS